MQVLLSNLPSVCPDGKLTWYGYQVAMLTSVTSWADVTYVMSCSEGHRSISLYT